MYQAGTYLIIFGSLVLLLRQLRHLPGDRLSALVMVIIWSRFALAALGPVAAKPVAAGQSLLALGTLGATVIGLLALPMNAYRFRGATPILLFIGVVAVSGVLNGGTSELVGSLIMWAFWMVCALMLHRAYILHGPRPVLGCLLVVFALPIAMQMMSFVLSQPKVGPDGSMSYIGSYVHESVFSIVALGALWLATIYPWRRRSDRLLVTGIVLAGLLLANYRTLIIAAAPLLLAGIFMVFGSREHFLRRAAIPAVLAFAVLWQFGPSIAGERYAEIGRVQSQLAELIKPPEEFTAREKDILSARVYIWSNYLYGFIEADWPQRLVGHGPASRPRGIEVHPHNEFLRILFQFGVLGMVAWLGLFVHQAVMAIRAMPHPAGVATAAGVAAMFVGALGTSFFNRPEGMVLFALLTSMNWYISDLRERETEVSLARRA